MFRVASKAPSRGPAPGVLEPPPRWLRPGEVAKALRESTAKGRVPPDQVRTVEKDLSRFGEERARFRSLNLNQLPEDAAQTADGSL